MAAPGACTPSSLVLLPAAAHPHPLALEVDALRRALHPHLSSFFIVAPASASAPCVALWRLPKLTALAAFHAARAADLVPVFLHDRATPPDVAAALRRVPCAALLCGPAAPPLGPAAPRALRVVVRVARAAPASPPAYEARAEHDFRAPAGSPLTAATTSTNSSTNNNDKDNNNNNNNDRSDTTCSPPPVCTLTPLPPATTPPPQWPCAPESPAVVFFTSGTTAAPKAVPLTAAQLRSQAAVKVRLLSLTPATRYLHLGPLFHVGAFTAALATTLAAGVHVFAPPRARPTAAAPTLLAEIARRSVTFLSVVPTVLRLLLDAAAASSSTSTSPSTSHATQQQQQQQQQLDCVRVVLYGAGPLATEPRAVEAAVAEARRTFPRARVLGAYGMTETASSITYVEHDRLPRGSPLHATMGWPAAGSGIEVRVVLTALSASSSASPSSSSATSLRPAPSGGGGDDDDGIVVGEIETRGPHVMCGYVGSTARSGSGNRDARQQQWWRTGDVGRVDQRSGALYVLGRAGDVIRSGGESVLPVEVETALVGAHSGVRDAAVVGVPHRVLGEAVAAAVVLDDGWPRRERGQGRGRDDSGHKDGCSSHGGSGHGAKELGHRVEDRDGQEEEVMEGRETQMDLAAVVARACERLARYKRPQWVFPVDDLPRNVSGKVIRHAVRTHLLQRIGADPLAKL